MWEDKLSHDQEAEMATKHRNLVRKSKSNRCRKCVLQKPRGVIVVLNEHGYRPLKKKLAEAEEAANSKPRPAADAVSRIR